MAGILPFFSVENIFANIESWPDLYTRLHVFYEEFFKF